MGLRAIILGSSLLLPSFLCAGDSGRPVQKQAAIPVWNDPNNLDQRVLAHAKKLYSQAYTLYRTGEEKRADKRFGEARTAAEMGVIFLTDAEKLLLEEEKNAKAPSIDLFLAQIYWLRDLPSSTSLDRESDHGLAVPRWESFLKALGNVDPNHEFVKECKTKLFMCRYKAVSENVSVAQLLLTLADEPDKMEKAKRHLTVDTVDEVVEFAGRVYAGALFHLKNAKAKTAEDALKLAEKLYTEALPDLKILARDQPYDPEILRMLSTCYFRLGKLDDSLIYLRELVRIQPADLTIYQAFAKIYLEKKTIWKILDETKRINHPDAKYHLAGAAAAALDAKAEATGKIPFFTIENNEDAQAMAELFYESAKVRYDLGKKQGKSDFSPALADLFFAGLADYSIGIKNKDEDRCRQALQRVISKYNSMNLQLPIADEFKRLIDEKIILDWQFTNKFYEGLKEFKR